MLLLAGPAPEILNFLQIISLISLPALLVAVAVAAFFHYRKKKEKFEISADKESLFLGATAELVGYTNGNGEYILFDHSRLIQEYKSRLLYNHARYKALRAEYAAMQSKYAELVKHAQTQLITHNKETMETTQEQMPGQLQENLAILTAADPEGKKELLAKLKHLERAYERLESEHRALQEQANLGSASEEERTVILSRWKEENTLLRDKVADQEYLEDLLNEKKAQINFLQHQLEQRIKNLYQSEHQRLLAVAETKQLKENNEAARKRMESLEHELLLKQEYSDRMQVRVCEKEEQLAERQQSLNEKLDHIAYLENALLQAKHENELLSRTASANADRAAALQKKLSDEQSKAELALRKAAENMQLMRQLHKELSVLIDEEEESPVIALVPGFSRENSETAV